MNPIKWFFISKYNKLIYRINTCRGNKQRLYLQNGIILDFINNTISYEVEEENVNET